MLFIIIGPWQRHNLKVFWKDGANIHENQVISETRSYSYKEEKEVGNRKEWGGEVTD